MYLLKSIRLKGGPLSVLIFFGIPRVANMQSNFGMQAFAEVDVTISTSGNLEYVSVTTSKYCPLCGIGPKNRLLSFAMALSL
jgi:hypothetical protein